MTNSRYAAIVCIFLAILHREADSQDILDDERNGCRWHGGSISGLVCDCRGDAEVTLNSNTISYPSTTEIVMKGCRAVKIEANTIAGLRNLRLVSLSDIQQIRFDSDSINWYGYRDSVSQVVEEERFDVTIPSLKLLVRNSNVSEIASHAFAGRIGEIILDGVVVNKISPLAFVNLLQTEKISIRNSALLDVGVQAFKKFATEQFELVNVTADLVPSRAISNITVYQSVVIDNCDFNAIRSGGFTIYNPSRFRLTNSRVGNLNGEGFKIISRGIVSIRNNTFVNVDDGGFAGITLQKDVITYKLTFDSNRIRNMHPTSLSTSEPYFQFTNIILDEACDCTAVDDKIRESSYYKEIKCTYENELTPLDVFKTKMCSVVNQYYIVIIIASVVAILIAAILLGLYMYYRNVYKRQKYGDKKAGKNGNMSLIVPDGRTYRETELHVIVERADLLTTDL
ncbi:unnamed protein product [Phyllotreta striolata]|uniref:Right handed beta helix domain-containing protein n=1 Tax=Phyllotreta striolata TaxID=444603 RepID=A0A9N9XNC1_PHYSR|nr:unnamed protein product [Phyllotreta striolata]